MDYKSAYVRSVLYGAIPAAVTLAVNVLCVIFRTDENHYGMLAVNIITDWLCGVFLVYHISCRVVPKKSLYRLSLRRREEVCGVVDRIDTQPIRYERLFCVSVHIGKRRLFAPEEMVLPREGERAVFSVAGNVILGVTQ